MSVRYASVSRFSSDSFLQGEHDHVDAIVGAKSSGPRGALAAAGEASECALGVAFCRCEVSVER